MPSRSQLISELKGSGVKGSLSKMNKAKLLQLHKELEKSVLDDGDASLQLMSGPGGGGDCSGGCNRS